MCIEQVIMNDLVFEDLTENCAEIVISSECDADSSQAKTAQGTLDFRPVSPSFLHALGLIKITSEETTTTSVPLSKSCATGTDKHADGSHTSASKKLSRPQSKSVTGSSTAKKTSVAKKVHVSKPKSQAKKRSHASSSNEPRSIPAVDAKKMRKPAAPTTDKPTTKKEPKRSKKQQHEASPPATKVTTLARKSAAKTVEKLSEFVDEVRFWIDVSETDFKLTDYRTLLMNNQFTEEQTEALQKSLQHLSRTFCSGPLAVERLMKTYQCTDCDFSMSHECSAMNDTEYWPLHCNAPCIESITPESMTMCICNFSLFHSHISQPKSKKRLIEPSCPPTACDWVEDNHAVNLDCPKCCMRITMTTRYAEFCFDMMNFTSLDGPIRKKFARFVSDNADFPRKKHPVLTEFYSCPTLCCMLFHRCDRDVMYRRSTPMQPHRPHVSCHI